MNDTFNVVDEGMMDPLEVLYDDYAESHGGPTKEILLLSKELREKLSGMSHEATTAIFENVAFLCAEYERSGFFGGVRTGMILERATKR